MKLPSPQQELAGALLQMSRKPDGYRIIMGNLSKEQQRRMETFEDGLSYHKVKKLMAQCFRKFHIMHQELDRTRTAGLGRRVFYPPNSMKKGKFYVVRVGRIPGLYYDYLDAEEQINGVSGAVWKSFTTLAAALEYQKETALPTPSDTVELTPPDWEIYTDGSYTATLDRAGWGFLALGSYDKDIPLLQRAPHHKDCGPG